MKSFRTIIIIVLLIGFLFSNTSFAVLPRKDNGKHKGWHKASSNPHHLNVTNPVKSSHKSKK